MYKKCKSCDTWKPFEDFYKCKKAADKHQTHCKNCKSEWARQVKNTNSNLTHKTCNKCHTEKPAAEFRKCSVNRDGLRHDCKVCHSEADRAYRQLNKERKLELNRAYTLRNKDKVLAKTRKYQAKKLNRTPEYLTEDDFQAMKEMYTEARRLTEQTGIPHEVDHIVPLQGREAQGMHEPSNLQIITRSENRSKSNKVN
jgi:hypothetical protein